MRSFTRTTLIAALLPLFSPLTWALGLGEITMKSHLNEPLQAEIELLDVQNLTSDDIKIRLATQQDFDLIGVDRAYFLTNIQFNIVVSGDDSRIILTTDQPLLEPFLDFLVETRWPAGRLLRSYTVLVDLPERASAERVSSYAQIAASESETQDAAEEDEPAQLVSAPTPPSQRPRARSYDKNAEGQPRAGGQYLVQARDTLWEIAVSARPENATVDQTMIATAAMNGDAFAGGNINGLRAGYVLQLPSDDEILTTISEARQRVVEQNQDWAAGIRRPPALRVVADNEFEDLSSENGVEARDAQVGSSSSADREFKDDASLPDANAPTELASAQMSASGAANEVESAIESGVESDVESDVGSVESADAAGTRANLDLAAIEARLSRLGEQVTDLRQLVTVKDEQIAALQAQIEQREVMAAQAAQKESERSSINELAGLPWWVFAFGGVLLISVGGLFFARRGTKLSVATGVSAPLAVPAALAEPIQPLKADLPDEIIVPSTNESQNGERGYGKDPHNDYLEVTVISDALAEAEIYVAYGRYQQALELLERASKADPKNPAPYLKRIKIYLQHDRRAEAEALVKTIEQTHDTKAVQQALALLEHNAPSTSGIDLGDLADDTSGVETGGPITGDPIKGDPIKGGFTGTPQEPEANASTDTQLGADWGDLGDANLTIDDNTLPPELAAVLGMDTPPPFEETDDESELGLIYASDTNPIETKLDLARAYIDMGDEEGARPVLDEVANEGDLQQQAEARELLLRIE
jgi:pilus assembly protein FimV